MPLRSTVDAVSRRPPTAAQRSKGVDVYGTSSICDLPARFPELGPGSLTGARHPLPTARAAWPVFRQTRWLEIDQISDPIGGMVLIAVPWFDDPVGVTVKLA